MSGQYSTDKACEICGSTNKVCKSTINYLYCCLRHRKQLLKKGYVYDPRKSKYEDIVSIVDGQAYINIRNRLGEIIQRSLIDLEDIDFCKKHIWNIARDRVTTVINGETKYLHRLLTNCPDDMYVDHINRDTYDNRKSNLRICTNQENNRNKGLYSHNSSGCTGVVWDKARNKWKAQIVVNDKCIFLGRFDEKEDAITARRLAEIKYFGEYRDFYNGGIHE